MATLSDTWYVEPLFDYEYKTYEVLAFVGGMEKQFSLHKLFPYLSELRKQINNLEDFRKAKTEMSEGLRRELLDVDLRRLQLIRASLPNEQGIMDELDEIIKFAVKAMEGVQVAGEKQLDDLKNQVNISPLGVLGAPDNPGFLLVQANGWWRIYNYHFRLVRQLYNAEPFKDVCTQYLYEVKQRPFMNLNAVKWELVKKQPALHGSVINAYAVEAQIDLPYYETLMPIVKDYLIRTVT